MQETQSTLEKATRETTLNPDTLKLILALIVMIISFLIKP